MFFSPECTRHEDTSLQLIKEKVASERTWNNFTTWKVGKVVELEDQVPWSTTRRGQEWVSVIESFNTLDTFSKSEKSSNLLKNHFKVSGRLT